MDGPAPQLFAFRLPRHQRSRTADAGRPLHPVSLPWWRKEVYRDCGAGSQGAIGDQGLITGVTDSDIHLYNDAGLPEATRIKRPGEPQEDLDVRSCLLGRGNHVSSDSWAMWKVA